MIAKVPASAAFSTYHLPYGFITVGVMASATMNERRRRAWFDRPAGLRVKNSTAKRIGRAIAIDRLKKYRLTGMPVQSSNLSGTTSELFREPFFPVFGEVVDV